MSLRRIRAVANIPIRRKVESTNSIILKNDVKVVNDAITTKEKLDNINTKEADRNSNDSQVVEPDNNSKSVPCISDFEPKPCAQINKLDQPIAENIVIEVKENKSNTSVTSNLCEPKQVLNPAKAVISRSRIKVAAKIPVRNKHIEPNVKESEKNALKIESEEKFTIVDTSINHNISDSNVSDNLKNSDLSTHNQVTDQETIVYNKLEKVNNKFAEKFGIIQLSAVNSDDSNKEILKDSKTLAPPQSPSKLIPRRYKPTPRTDRRNSIAGSASESEEDCKRCLSGHTRNDSVCSTTNNGTGIGNLPENSNKLYVPVKKKSVRSDIARKMAEARREFLNKFGNKMPDKQKLTMMDLIFYNPPNNPMTKREPQSNELRQVLQKTEEESRNDEESVDNPEEENSLPAPQVKVGPNGEIILDEQSLVIETSDMKKAREFKPTAVVIDDLNTGYGIYKRSQRTKGWTEAETLQFYRVLQITGTDFSMMLNFFQNRSRRDLKVKFKKEERLNRLLIDKVLLNPRTFDLDECQRLLDKDRENARLKEVAIKKAADEKLRIKLLKKQEAREQKTTGRRKNISWFSRQMIENEVIEPPKKRAKQTKWKDENYKSVKKGSDSDSEVDNCSTRINYELQQREVTDLNATEDVQSITETFEENLSQTESNDNQYNEDSSSESECIANEFNKSTEKLNSSVGNIEPGSIIISVLDSASGRQVKQVYTVYADDTNKPVSLTDKQLSLLSSYLDGNDSVSLDLPVVDGSLSEDGTVLLNN